MPTISRSFGIAIVMFFDDHGFPGNAGDAVGSDGSSELGLGPINRRVHSGGGAIDQALRGLA